MYQSAESGQDLDSSSIEISQHVSEPILSKQQKYRKAFQVAQSLSQQLSTFGMRDFNDGLETLESLSRIWGKGKKAIVEELSGIIALLYIILSFNSTPL